MRLKKIGDTIKKYRIYRQMEHQDLAQAISKTKSYISRIENGNLQTPPSEETLAKIADVLCMSTEDKDEILYLAAEERTPTLVLEKIETLSNKLNEDSAKLVKLYENFENALENLEVKLKSTDIDNKFEDIRKESFYELYDEFDDDDIKLVIKRFIEKKFSKPQ